MESLSFYQQGDRPPLNPSICPTELPPESARTANRAQTTGFFGVKKGVRGTGVDRGYSLCG